MTNDPRVGWVPMRPGLNIVCKFRNVRHRTLRISWPLLSAGVVVAGVLLWW